MIQKTTEWINFEVPAEPPTATESVGAATEGVGVTFGEVQFPPQRSSTGRQFYVFRPEHKLGATVAGSWSVAKRVWGDCGFGRTPKGYASLDEAISAVVWEFRCEQATEVRLVLH